MRRKITWSGWFQHFTKKCIYTNLLGANMVQRCANEGEMVNTALACQFTWGCKLEGKCGIYDLRPLFNLGLHFFAPNLD